MVLPHSTVGIRIRSTVFSPDIVTILYIILAHETYILVLVMVRVCSWFDFGFPVLQSVCHLAPQYLTLVAGDSSSLH